MSLRLFSKAALAHAARSSGFDALARCRLRKYLTVLCYHGVVSRRAGSSYLYRNTVTVDEFESHLRYLTRYFHPVSISDVIRWREGTAELPNNPVLVTFDDGYRNNLRYAGPLLSRHGVPALVNICTSYIGEGRMLWTQEIDTRLLAWTHKKLPMPDGKTEILMPADGQQRIALAARVRESCKHLPDEMRRAYLCQLRGEAAGGSTEAQDELFSFMGWDEVRELEKYGVEIGSHTVTHPILTRISPEQLHAELTDSKAIVEKELRHECVALAYPNGGKHDVSPAVFAAAKSAGFKVAFTLIEGFNSRLTNSCGFLRIAVAAEMPPAVFFDRISGVSAMARLMGWTGTTSPI